MWRKILGILRLAWWVLRLFPFFHVQVPVGGVRVGRGLCAELPLENTDLFGFYVCIAQWEFPCAEEERVPKQAARREEEKVQPYMKGNEESLYKQRGKEFWMCLREDVSPPLCISCSLMLCMDLCFLSVDWPSYFIMFLLILWFGLKHEFYMHYYITCIFNSYVTIVLYFSLSDYTVRALHEV